MFDTPQAEHATEARSGQPGGPASDHRAEPRRRRRHPWRVVLITLGSLFALVVVAAIGSYAYVNHVVSSIPRLQVAHLVADNAASGSLDGQTFLVTSFPQGPTGTPVQQTAQSQFSNLVMLLHTDANGKGGGAVTIPGYVRVNVPGAGTEPLWDAMQNKKGSPSLLVQTITQLTGIPINHYAQLDFNHISSLVNAVGGIDVTIPAATKGFGYTFKKGVNHLTGVTAIYYGRDPTIKGQDRLLRQENLVRTVITTIANGHLLTNPFTMVHVLNAITSMLAVDSNFTNADIESLVRQFGRLAADAATFVTAPTQTVRGNIVPNVSLDNQLWSAVKHDSIAAFAKKYPSTVAPKVTP
jgi:LCP family protein required for cell wall assembly